MYRYYFASRFSNHETLRDCRDELNSRIPDTVVTSRWIDLHRDIVGPGIISSFIAGELNADPENCWRYGKHDLVDLDAADAIVSFTGIGGKGGRHIEHGYAIAKGKRLVIVGERENVFHCHPDTEVYSDWDDFLIHEIESQ